MDTVQTGVVNVDLPQPNADVGSLCTAMIFVSPHGSNNWAKIPCDYPMFDAGLICKQKAQRLLSNEGDDGDDGCINCDGSYGCRGGYRCGGDNDHHECDSFLNCNKLS